MGRLAGSKESEHVVRAAMSVEEKATHYRCKRTSFSYRLWRAFARGIRTRTSQESVCGGDGYGDISSHVQSHNVTRNTRAHQSFSRKWILLPSSCSVSTPCTRGYFVRSPTIVRVCTCTYIRRLSERKGEEEA